MATDSQVVYLNGAYLPREQATLSIDERAALFADGVYEVVPYVAGRSFRMQPHIDRLKRSLKAIDIEVPGGVDHLSDVSDELVRRNGLSDARVYWQVSRGAAPRNHVYDPGMTPTILATADASTPADPSGPCAFSVLTVEDERWHNCWIKSLMLLPSVLAKRRAADAGADEAVFIRDGIVTEGASTNLFIVQGEELVTHPADRWILPGITRQVVIELAEDLGLACREAAFSLEAVLEADEVLLTGSGSRIAAVTTVNGRTIGKGSPGGVTCRLYGAFLSLIDQG